MKCVMLSLNVWCLLSLTILLVSITPTETEVVQSMSQCKGFLLKNRCPQVPGILEKGQIKGRNRYKVICQTYENERKFVTLYDTKNKIPVLSAYKYRGAKELMEEETRPNSEWKTEPQLENMKSNKNMEACDERVQYKHQASNNDYKKDNDFNRGHLFPSSYAFDETDKISTFTLTNIVPQAITFNGGSWETMENYVKSILKKHCVKNNNVAAYVVTGAKPSPDTKLNDTVNVPSMLWSVFCCYSHQNRKWIAGAFWGDNKPDGPKTTNLQMKTLEKLYDELSAGSSRFEAFPGTKCPLKETPDDSLNMNARYKYSHFTNVFQDDKYEGDDAHIFILD